MSKEQNNTIIVYFDREGQKREGTLADTNPGVDGGAVLTGTDNTTGEPISVIWSGINMQWMQVASV